MNRRTLLTALGAIGAGGAVVTGTGAFTSVEANRDVTVEVADDANALLAIEQGDGPNGNYATTTGGTLGIDLTSDNDNLTQDPNGVNANAVTVIEDLFTITNQGTQEVDVEVSPLLFIDDGSGNLLVVLVVPQTSFPSVRLSPGGTEVYHVVVGAFSGGTNPEIDDTITVSAEAT
jgi:hypothetical protein